MVLIKKTSTAMEYEYSMKYIYFFLVCKLNHYFNSKNHRTYYGQLPRAALS